MRTTLTLDYDVEKAVNALLAKPGAKFKSVINNLLRKGLGISKKRKIIMPTFSMGLKEGIDPVSLNKLLDEMDLEDYFKKIKNS